MLNFYFYDLSKGIIVDFSVAFNPNPAPNFANIYPTWMAATTCSEYLVEEPGE
jgi:hypothetical protein